MKLDTYYIYIDDACVNEIIPLTTQLVERFYEACDELDEYDNSLFESEDMGTDNFFIRELKEHNE